MLRQAVTRSVFQQTRRQQPALCAILSKNNYSTSAKELWTAAPQEFIQEMQKAGIRRGYIIHDVNSKTTQTSHPIFEQLAERVVNDKRDFLGHEALFFEVGKQSNALMAAFIQKTVRGIPQGGVRLWNYNTVESVVRDGLRLSAGMGRKNALSGLYWGGGKGIIVRNTSNLNFEDAKVRDMAFRDYGDFLTSLRGAYYGAEDVGLTPEDTARMFTRTRFMTCIPQELGGSGNPSQSTGLGVVCGMEAALEFLGLGSLKGKKVVIQGAGNVAGFILHELVVNKQVEKVIMTDINAKLIEKRREEYKDYANVVEFRVTTPDDSSILAEPCDILAPCALGGILNTETINNLNCKIVAGAANNQLLDPVDHDQMLKDKNILYVPDYLLNRMGIVNCANENYGYVKNDPMITRHFGREWESSIFNIATSVFQSSQSNGIPTGIAANMLADQLANEPHPIFGHRGWQIIQGLIADKWAEK